MTHLEWQDASTQKHHEPVAAHATEKANPWFAITMGLIGLVVGYALGIWLL